MGGSGEGEVAARRLEEMMLGISSSSSSQGPQLPEELIRANDQRQEDEMLALESIYGDDVVIFGRKGGLRCFEIYVHYEFPDGIEVSAKFQSISGVSKDGEKHHLGLTITDDSDEFLYTCNIHYLPPVILTCLLPPSYPSNQPPCFTITVQWLDSQKISSLCRMLDSIWSEQSGQEAIFQWVEWLRNSSLSYLGYDHRIVLDQDSVSCDGDSRAISRSVSLESIVRLVKSYNSEKCHEIFLKSLHQCAICFSEGAGTTFIKLPCRHFFCLNCMEIYTRMHVKEGTVVKLKCPDSQCDGAFPPYVLKRLLVEEDYERWESFVLQKALDSMSDLVYCPRCGTACLKDEDDHAQCSKCFFSFCTLCRENRHVGSACITPEDKLRHLQERKSSACLTGSQLRKEQELINEMLSIREVFQDAKPCPSCKMAISRTEGCNKMACRNCGQFFCFRCTRAIDGYDHFRGGGCKLFPDEDNLLEENEMNEYQVVQQIRAQLNPEHGLPCPDCHVLNVKVGDNNHMFCWSCQIHYCALCHKVVTKRAQHYGPNGCRQYSSDTQ